ncbi:MAG: DNA repair protein RecN [Bacilli bacterium]|nr:DNA repair protein RecN [Bacilli bacterium]
MLTSLSVQNFAIIDNLKIDFKNCLTVLTGETGAGKSLIIDCISLLFGKRASTEMIRFGEEKATIVGLFSNYSEKINNLLKEYDIDFDCNEDLIIKRDIYSSGKSKCSINNTVVTLNQLNEIGEYIGDIHSQNDSLGLINPKNYLSFLNNEKIDNLSIEYNNSLKNYKIANKEYNDLIDKKENDDSRSDFLKYQLKELNEASLDVQEEIVLKEELKELNHYEQLYENINVLKDNYHNKDTIDNLYESLKALDTLRNINNKYDSLYKLFEESYYNIEAVYEDNLLEIKEFDNQRLDYINDRLGLYSSLKRKYKKDVKEILEYQKEISDTLYNLENYDSLIEDLKNKKDKLYKDTYDIAKKMSEERKKEAKALVDEVINNLNDLMLKNVKWEIEFSEANTFLKDGIDICDFLVSFNKGEPVKPLSKVASGGELSRFMLAIKTVLGSKLPQQTKIFDEIDSGVSGAVAYSIANKIDSISKQSQVLCITHLPQVASISDNHIKIEKRIENNRTITLIKELDKEEKILEIASMISNGKATDASINLAREMIKKI